MHGKEGVFMKTDLAVKVSTVLYSIVAGLWAWFVVQAIIVVLVVGNPSKLNRHFPVYKPVRQPSFESIKNDPEARKHTALNFWKKEFRTDGSLVFVKGVVGDELVSEAPFGRPAMGFDRVESLTYWRGMERFGIQHRELRIHQAVEAHSHHAMILPVYTDGQLESQWTYDIRRQILAGRETDLDKPRKADVRIGYLGSNGLMPSRDAAEALGDFVRCHIIAQPKTGDTNLMLWQTTECIYVLDLHRNEVLLHRPWPFLQVDIGFPRSGNKPGMPVLEMGCAAVGLQTWAGDWVVFMRSADGADTVFQGSELPGSGKFGIAGKELYFQEFGSEQADARKLPRAERNDRLAELHSRPWKEWAMFHRVGPTGGFKLIKRHEWMRDPLRKQEEVDTLPRHVHVVFNTFVKGTLPLGYALANHQLSDLRTEMMDSRIPRSRWTEFKLAHFKMAYTHWQLLWTAVALGGFLLYQRKRRLARPALVGWGVVVLAMGLSGLLACWIASRRKKGMVPPEINRAPQQLLIAE
jgi:hypothetical protein